MKRNDDDMKRNPGGGDVFEPGVEPMEVRLVALALGEVSESERAELEAAMAAERELKLFYDRICGADLLLDEALTEGGDAEIDDWRMDKNRRGVVFAKIRGSQGETVNGLVVDSEGVKAGEVMGKKPSWFGQLGSIAAALVALIAIAGLFLPMGVGLRTGMMMDSAPMGERWPTTSPPRATPALAEVPEKAEVNRRRDFKNETFFEAKIAGPDEEAEKNFAVDGSVGGEPSAVNRRKNLGRGRTVERDRFASAAGEASDGIVTKPGESRGGMGGGGAPVDYTWMYTEGTKVSVGGGKESVVAPRDLGSNREIESVQTKRAAKPAVADAGGGTARPVPASIQPASALAAGQALTQADTDLQSGVTNLGVVDEVTSMNETASLSRYAGTASGSLSGERSGEGSGDKSDSTRVTRSQFARDRLSVESRELEEGEEDLGEITADSPASKEAEMLGEDMGATDPFSGLLFSGGAAVENTSEPLAARGEGRSPEDGVEIDNSYYSMDPSPANGGMDLHFKSNKKFNGPILKEKFSIGSTDSKIREGELYKNRLSQLPGNPGQLFDVELGDNDADAGQPMEAPPKGGSVYEAVEESGRTGTGEKVMGYASADLESRDGYLFREGGQRSFAFQEKQAAAGEPGVWGIATTALETATAAEAFSTFSLNVSDVSYQLAAAALLEEGTWPEPDKVRVEEFVNAFDYGDPSVTLEEKVGCRTEQVSHPFKQQRNLVRVSMRVAAAGRSAGQPLRLTVLLDKSGSMEREDREAAVAKAMDALASHLTADDVISVIGFARTPRLIADRMSGDRAGELADLVAQAPSEGGTNLEQALAIGREVALRQRLEGGVNRIVLMTDGAANLGDARPDALSEMVVRLRNEGVAFDACGVGADGLNDEILEALTREGDGRYYFLNRVADADEGFVRQLAGALRPAAKNVKVQVEFNPERVRGYRLLGFEKHRLEKEDFRNDTVDAAEMAAEEAGVAVYQTEVIPEGTGDVGKVWVRFQDAVTGEMVERSWRIPYKARAPRLFEAPPAMKLAATAVLFGERLKGGAGGDAVELGLLRATCNELRQDFPGNQRIWKLMQMMEAVRELEQ